MTITLSDLKTEVLTILGDSGSAKYSDALLTEAFIQALSTFDKFLPQVSTATLILATTTDEVSLASILTNCIKVISIEPTIWTKVIPPYYVFFKAGVPWVKFLGSYVRVVGQTFRVIYSCSNTIAGLGTAATSTIADNFLPLLVRGVVSFAKQFRVNALSEKTGTSEYLIKELQEESEKEKIAYLSDLATQMMSLKTYQPELAPYHEPDPYPTGFTI